MDDDEINVATVRADGAVLLAGCTTGSWEVADSDISKDFAAVLLSNGAVVTTPLPTTLDQTATLPPTTLQPSPNPTSLEPATTLPPTVLDLAPTLPLTSPESTRSPTNREPAITTPSPVQSSAPSNALVLPTTASSGSSGGLNQFIVGAVVGVAGSLVVIGLCVLRHRRAMGTVDRPASADDENANYPQAITPPQLRTPSPHA